jgi:polyisoprenoid-binding protein YceI
VRVPALRYRPTLPLFALLLAASANPVAAQAADDRMRLTVAAEGNEARFRVREQLARIDFPSDAVGTTSNVTGALVLEADGRVVREASRFTIDMASLTTDSQRRDNYIRRRTLATDTFATAVFVPTELRGLAFPLRDGEHTFQLVGDLTIRDATRPTTWDVTARVADGVVTGLAKTSFTFADFQMTKPRVGSVLSVEDEIRVEYDFRLVPDR